MKKRILSLFLAFVMMVSLAVPAYADTDQPENDAQEEVSLAEPEGTEPEGSEPEAAAEEGTETEEPAAEEPDVVSEAASEAGALLPYEGPQQAASVEPAAASTEGEGSDPQGTYTVTFDANGGYFNDDPELTQLTHTVTPGDELNDYPTPKHASTGYVFRGWFDNADGVGEEIDTYVYVPSGDVTFYAKWEQLPVAQMGENAVAVNAGEDTYLLFTPEADGWYVIESTAGHDPMIALCEMNNGEITSDDDGGENWNFLLFSRMAGGKNYKLRLYDREAGEIRFTIRTTEVYSVFLNANGGYFCGDETFTQGEVLLRQGGSLVPSNYWPIDNPTANMRVDGWYYDAACTELAVSGANSFFPTSNVTLYAHWATIPTAQLGENTATITAGEAEEFLFTPIESGYYKIVTYSSGSAYYMRNEIPNGCCVYSNDDCHDDGSRYISSYYEMTAGTSYRIRIIDDRGNFSGDTSFTIEKAVLYTVTLNANGGFYSELVGNEYDVSDAKCMLVVEGRSIVPTTYYWDLTHSDSSLAVDSWYYDAECTQLAVSGNNEYYPTGDVTLYAHWAPLPTVQLGDNTVTIAGLGESARVRFTPAESGFYKLTTSSDDSQRICSEIMYRGSHWNYRESRDGLFTCRVWYELTAGETYTICVYDDWANFAGDTSLTIVKGNVYTVTLDANGGYFDNNPDTTRISFLNNEDWGFTPSAWNPRQADEHMAVDSWYFDAECTQYACPSNAAFIPTSDSDVTLYAHWVRGNILTFDGNGGWFNDDPEQTQFSVTVAPGSSYGSNPYVYTDENHMWDNNGLYYLTPECDGEPVSALDYVPEGDVTLYAKVQAVYRVTLNANGGYFHGESSVTSDWIGVQQGASLRPTGYFSITHPDRTLAVDAWYYDAACTELAVSGSDEFWPTESVTLYAHWAPVPTAQLGVNSAFTSNGAMAYFLFTPEEDGYYSIESASDGDAYIYLYDENENVIGFDDDGAGDMQFRLAMELSAGTTYKLGVSAGWSYSGEFEFTIAKAEVYNILFDANGSSFYDGTTQKTVSVVQGASLYYTQDEPLSTGNTYFAGWSRSPDGASGAVSVNGRYVPTGDMTLYAVWLPCDNAVIGNNSIESTNGYRYAFLFTPAENGRYLIESTSGVYVGLYLYNSDGGWLDSQGGVHARASAELNVGETYRIEIHADDPSYTGKLGFEISKPDFCTVTFSSDRGYIFGEEDNTLLTRITPVGRPLDFNPAVYNYDSSEAEFVWWSLTPDGERVDALNFAPSGDTTLYAVWKQRCTVTFDANGGYFGGEPDWLTNSEYLLQGEKLQGTWGRGAENADPHLIFDAYYYDADCTEVALRNPDHPYIVVEDDITLYAGWTAATVITLDANGGYFNIDGEQNSQYTVNCKPGSKLNYAFPRPAHDDGHKAFLYWADPQGNRVPNVHYQPTGDVTLTAVWADAYEVTFDFNGGEIRYGMGGESQTLSVPVGEPICYVASSVGEPMIEGADGNPAKLLGGWYLDAACTQRAVNPFGMIPTGDMTLYAGYVDACKVTFHYPDGQYSQYYAKGSFLLGYYGEDYYLDSACTQHINVSTYRITGDVDFYENGASGSENRVNVTLVLNGGSYRYDGDVSETYVLSYGKGIYLDNEWMFIEKPFAKDGCYLVGFSLTPDGAELYDLHTVLTEDLTLYLIWDEGVTLTFNGNGQYFMDRDTGDPTDTYCSVVAPGEPIIDHLYENIEYTEWLPDQVIEGWYLDTACTQPVTADLLAQQDTVLYAKWAEPYLVTFDPNGATSRYEETGGYNYTVAPGKTLEYLPAFQNPDGMILDGWSLDRAGTQRIEEIWTYVPDGDVTIYAQWIEGHTLYLDSNGGSFWGGNSSNYDEVGVPAGSAVGDDHKWYDDDCAQAIEGWYYDPACTQSAGDISELIPTDDMTLYAKWVDGILVRADANGGNYGYGDDGCPFIAHIENLAPGDKIPAYWIPEREGYLFLGFATDADSSEVVYCVGDPIEAAAGGELMLYAVWAAPSDEVLIVKQPQSVIADVNEEVSFSVHAVFAGELSYQWQFANPDSDSWGNSSGTGNKTDTMTITAARARNGMQYRCKITDENGNEIYTDAATLTVANPLVIVSQPESYVGEVGGTAVFTVEASGDGLSYQWQFANPGSDSWGNSGAAGSKTAEMTVEATNARIGMQYRCRITDAYGRQIFTDVVTIALEEKDIALDAAHFPDAAFRSYLAGFDKNSDGILSEEERASASANGFLVDNKGISSLEGLRYFPDLVALYCRENALTSLDISCNTKLRELACDFNRLTALDVSKAPDLELLYCRENAITSLDLSQNTKLVDLDCDDNPLTELDITHNPELVMVWAGGSISSIDLSQNAKLTQLCLFSPALTSLDLSHNPQLSMLGLSNSQLTSLDLSHNPELDILNCENNRLTELDVSHNPKLSQIDCPGNSLTSLDLSHNPDLTTLFCQNNQLTSLDLSHNPELEHLECGNNLLSSLNFSGLTKLRFLDCSNNRLTTLDVSAFMELDWLACYGNSLTSLDVRANGKLPIHAEPVTDPEFGEGVLVYREVLDEWGGEAILAIDEDLRLITQTLEIVSQPESYVGVVNQTATFTVEATGDDLSYQWQFANPGSDSWGNSGGTGNKTDTMTIAATKARDGMQYRCKITDANGDVLYTEVVTITIIRPLEIVTQPVSYFGALGSTAVFSVKAEGEGLTYQWQFAAAGSDSWGNSGASGNRSDTLSIAATNARNNMRFRCRIKDAYDNILYSDVVTITIGTPLEIVSQPESFECAEGSTATFTVEALGDGLSYQWQIAEADSDSWRNAAESGSTTPTMSFTATKAYDGLQFRCKITDERGNEVFTDTAAMLVVTPLVIVSQPENYLGFVNTTAVFTVEATGEGLSYQWQYANPGSNVWGNSGGTGNKTASMTIAATKARDGMQYRCRITDVNGDVLYTDVVTITIMEPLTIKSQPESYEGAVNGTAVFSVEATGEGLSYQWQFAAAGSDSWGNSGGTGNKTNTMTIAATKARDGMQYRCRITSANGETVYTDVVTITIVTPLEIVSQPESYEGVVNGTATFTVIATGEGLTYQWQFASAGSDSWGNSGGTGNKTKTMTIAATNARNGMQYRCRITDANGDVVYTDVVTITIVKPLTIVSQPESYEGRINSTAVLAVEATGDGLSYQWQYANAGSEDWSDSDISGNQTNTLAVAVTSARDGMQFRCKITDARGNVAYTDVVTVTVVTPLAILSQPQNYEGAAGSTAIFTVEAAGEGLSYQWQFANANSDSWGNSGGTGNKTDTMTITATTARDGMQYRCRITDAKGDAVYTDVVTITIVKPLAIVTQPVSYEGVVNSTAVFTVEATGEGLAYQWQFANAGSDSWGNSGISGNRTPSLTVAATKARDGMQYRCRITDANGKVVYTEVVTITIVTPLEIVSQPTSYTGPVNSTATFTVKAKGEGLTYQWQFANAGSNSWGNSGGTGNKTDTMTITATNARNGMQYRCRITDANGDVLYTDAVTLTIAK